MPTLVNTTKIKRINNLVDSYKAKLDSPYNIYINKSPVPVEWYNQCKEHTSMDEATREVWSHVGAESPVRFNLIHDAVVYGMPQMNINWTVGDFGLSSDDISGDTIVLPNTWIPYPNDYFSIQHIDHDLLFKVTNVTEDTFPNGANYYRVEFSYDKSSSNAIKKQVVQEFRMILDNVGTEYNVIVKEDIYATVDKMDSIIMSLQNYYIQCFFKESLQTFVYNHDGANFYDPYMIEFLKRNSILENTGGFVYVNHELPLSATFSMDYAKTVFRCFELKDYSRGFNNRCVGKLIECAASIFYARSAEYYEIKYSNMQFAKSIDIMDGVLIDNIARNNAAYTGTEMYKNIIVKFFNDESYTDSEIKSLETMDVLDNKDCFYYIPMVIFSISYNLQELLKKK